MTPDLDALAARIETAIGNAMAAGELGDCRMVGEFTLIGTGIDEDGDKLHLITSNGDIVSTLGLLHWGLVRQEALLHKRTMREDDVQ